MLVGLGTGTTAAFLIEALGQRVREGLAIRTVVTSLATEPTPAPSVSRRSTWPIVAAIDLGIDGVDEIDPDFARSRAAVARCCARRSSRRRQRG